MAFYKITKLVLKSLFSKPATLMYPFVKRVFFENTRGQVAIQIENCIFCSICVKKCPTNAITVDRENKVWSIDRFKCITCAACVENCPKKCLRLEKFYSQPLSQSESKNKIEVFKI
ncbi:MAG: 4Fe-4S dicluster domain-containing protein [Candidatus Margulisiibacteriota bacterium]|jgi:formate hydrogenlyase subunit 6/NADH:ubiquinone oxidoreductase subunit I